MDDVEAALQKVREAGLRVVVAGEDDNGNWIVSLATSRKSELKTWTAGRGSNLEAALQDALGKRLMKSIMRKKTPAKAPENDLDELLG